MLLIGNNSQQASQRHFCQPANTARFCVFSGLVFSWMRVSQHSSTQGSSAGIPSSFMGDANLPDLNLAVAQLNIE